MDYFVGIDLHSNNCCVGMINEKDKRILERKFDCNLESILKTLNRHKKNIRGVVVESTYNWYWLVDGLMDAGYKVHLANPAAMQQYSGLKYSDDKSDAIWLAHMFRLGILPEGYIYPKEIRPVRDLLRKRLMLVRHRTSHTLSLENQLIRNTGTKYNVNETRALNHETLKEILNEKHLVMAARSDSAMISIYKEKSLEIEKAVIKEVKLLFPYNKLLTVPGIGKILAITIMLETGDINRFATVSHYSSYCRCVSSQRLSNGKKKGEGNKKNGNKYLSWAYVEAANFMKRYCEEARKWHQRKASKTNQIVATKALSSKISKACYFIIKDQSEFDAARLFMR